VDLHPSSSDGNRVAVRRAFTLVELMVVLALIGILSAMVLPEMRGTLEEALLRSSSRKLITACDVAFSRAIATGKTVRLEFDRSNGKYRLINESTGSNAGQPLDFPGGSGTVDPRITVDLRRISTQAAAPVRRSAGEFDPTESAATPGTPENGIEFRPDGTVDASEWILQDRAGFRLALRLNPITGRIRVRELPRS
jgi:prepilin-type N-terminal cleavage/methylation domain-containing protein